MGILDKFRNKKQNVNPINSRPQEDQKEFDVTYGVTTDGRLQVEFYDNDADFKQFYDITRLIVNQVPLTIKGQKIYNCIVSWYGSSDHHTLNKATGKMDSPRARRYKGVLAQIDLELLQKDPEYCKAVMKGLLNEKRVEKYLEQGLQETPNIPCGKYVGGVNSVDYTEFFLKEIGQVSHYSPHMVNKRQAYRERKAAAIQASINEKQKKNAERQAELAELQAKLNELNELNELR